MMWMWRMTRVPRSMYSSRASGRRAGALFYTPRLSTRCTEDHLSLSLEDIIYCFVRRHYILLCKMSKTWNGVDMSNKHDNIAFLHYGRHCDYYLYYIMNIIIISIGLVVLVL